MYHDVSELLVNCFMYHDSFTMIHVHVYQTLDIGLANG